jgi:GTPase SAR1 family protein
VVFSQFFIHFVYTLIANILFRIHIQTVKGTTSVPIVICANKSDLASERQVSREAGEKFAKSLDLSNDSKSQNVYIETSGKPHLQECL